MKNQTFVSVENLPLQKYVSKSTGKKGEVPAKVTVPTLARAEHRIAFPTNGWRTPVVSVEIVRQIRAFPPEFDNVLENLGVRKMKSYSAEYLATLTSEQLSELVGK